MNDVKTDAKAIFLEALDCEGADELMRFLEQACGADAALRARVEELLRAHEDAGAFLGGAQKQGATRDQSMPERAGAVIGPYKLLQKIGEGGMGTVWMAEQTHPVQRKVALKLIKSGIDSKQVIARFEAERQALALMDHPNIAKVLDAGTTEVGRPYFVMELVKGVPITKYCDEHHLTPKQRLELFVPVCQAVQHAHQKGIIHRDLKPSNVMVCLYDGKPVPKVIDFGIAKASGQQLTDRTMFTEIGQVVGTLEYMSPEQAELNQPDIDTRSDIYSLGVLLYELLTGSTPLERKRLRAAAMLEVLRLIREEEPPKPSTRLSTTDEMPSVAANRGLEPKKLSGVVRGELDWIVMKALEKDRNRRYETANGFAQDIQRHLADEPVQACPPSAGYRLRKFVRRNQRPVLAGCVIFLLLIGGIVGTTLGLLQAQAAAEAEGLAKIDALKKKTLAENAAAAESKARKAERDARDALDAARNEKEQQRQRTNLELSEGLVEAAGLREKSRSVLSGDAEAWNQFRAALRRVEALAASPLADPALVGRVRALQAELKRDQADRRMITQLEEIRLGKADRRLFVGGMEPLYKAAFKEYGLPVFDLDVEEAARRIAASPIRDWLVAALDHCAENSKSLVDRLIPVIQRVEKDNGPWVRAYYDARLHNDQPALLRLAKQPEALQQPPITICMVGMWISSMDRSSAVALLRQAQLRHPADLWINHYLAQFLFQEWAAGGKDDLKDAIGFARVALAARPDSRMLRDHLANRLWIIGDEDEANAHHRHLTQLGRPALGARNPLGWLLRAQYCAGLKQWDKAIAYCSKAIALDPKNAAAFDNRGIFHGNLGHLDKAVADLTRAIELNPKGAPSHFNLGQALRAQNKGPEAIAAYRKAIDLKPDYAEPHCNLAYLLRDQGDLSASLDLLKRGHAFGSKRKDWHHPSAKWVTDAERLVRLEAKLADVLVGTAAPADNRERLGLLEVCGFKRRHSAAARLYADAFAADPKVARDLKAGHRYNAACAAALAAAGQGTDAGELDGEEKSRLRKQALAWLRADLEQRSKRLEGGNSEDGQVVRASLQHWQRDADLASVRDADALKKLSAEERETWRKLWADVTELLKKADDAK